MNLHTLPAELPMNAGLDPLSQWDSDPNGAVSFIGIIPSQQDSHPNRAICSMRIIPSPFPVGFRPQQIHQDHPIPVRFRSQEIHQDHPFIIFPNGIQIPTESFGIIPSH